MKMRLRFLSLLGLALAVVPGPAAAGLKIVATTTDLAAIARAVGGEHVSVSSLTKGTSDPHFAVAKPSMIRKIFGADLLLLVGADLEIGWLPAALPAARNPRVQPGQTGYLDVSTAVSLLEMSSGPVNRAMGDVHAKGNPHFLLDPVRGGQAAREIAARMAAIDPGNRAAYRSGLDTFLAALEERLTGWRRAFAPLKGRTAIAYHKTFSYFADAFGLKVVGQIEPLPGISPTASHLASLVDRIVRERIPLVILAPYFERRSSAFLQRRTGVKVVVLPQSVGAVPGMETYFDLFDAIERAFSDAGAL